MAIEAGSMNRLLLRRTIIVLVGGVLCCSPSLAQTMNRAYQPPTQVLPPAPKAAHVEILQGPALEFARDDLAIVRWTINSPGGSDDHFGIVHYGTDPEALSLTAKSPFRLNRDHPETIVRVRIDGLKPLTTYYYRVTSIGSDDVSDGEKSAIERFATPAPGKHIVAFPQPK
jgi:hypothetical protein